MLFRSAALVVGFANAATLAAGMPPTRKPIHDAAPTRAIDAAVSSLQHLSEQERMITSRVLPQEDTIDTVFKPPEARTHTYQPTSSERPRGPSALSAPVAVRVPKALLGVGKEVGGPETADGQPTDASAVPLLSYQKVRRWDMLPKHAWLQAAESGQAPGPGFRDVSSTQTMRSYGPKGLPPLDPSSLQGSQQLPPLLPTPHRNLQQEGLALVQRYSRLGHEANNASSMQDSVPPQRRRRLEIFVGTPRY